MGDDLLPSVRFDRDNPIPIGFVLELSDGHVAAAGAALEELAAAFGKGGGSTELRVCLTSARYVPGLPFQLYSFQLVDFDQNGEVLDGFDGRDEVKYAFVVNQPVEVQREAALWFLYESVFRQAALRAPGVNANDADLIAARASEQARGEFSFRMQSGWREAVTSLDARAAHAGLRLLVRYERDPFPDRHSIVRRIPALRETYNSIGLAREFVDKLVSAIGGRDPRVIVSPGGNDVRTFIERHLLGMGMRQIIAQTTRDAFVLGNGFLVTPDAPDEGPYNLRPERVEIANDGRFHVVDAAGRKVESHEKVLHLRGVEQFDSPYGFSMLEVIVPKWSSRRTMTRILEKTEALMAKLPSTPDRTAYLNEVRALVARRERAQEQDLERLLWYPRDWLPDTVDGLYLPGQERL